MQWTTENCCQVSCSLFRHFFKKFRHFLKKFRHLMNKFHCSCWILNRTLKTCFAQNNFSTYSFVCIQLAIFSSCQTTLKTFLLLTPFVQVFYSSKDANYLRLHLADPPSKSYLRFLNCTPDY